MPYPVAACRPHTSPRATVLTPTLILSDAFADLSGWTQAIPGSWVCSGGEAYTASQDFAGDRITRDVGVALSRVEQREQFHRVSGLPPMHWMRQDGSLNALGTYLQTFDSGVFAAGSYYQAFVNFNWGSDFPAGDYDLSVFYLEGGDGIVFAVYAPGAAGTLEPVLALLYSYQYTGHTGTRISFSGTPFGDSDPIKQLDVYQWPAAAKVLITDGDSITSRGWPQVLRVLVGYPWGGTSFALPGQSSPEPFARSDPATGTSYAAIAAAKAAGKIVTVVLAVGVNDLGNNVASLTNLKSNVAATVANYVAAGADHVYVCTILPTQTTTYPETAIAINAAAANFNAWIVGNSGATKIDTASWPALADPTDTTYYDTDSLHPNPRGEWQMAKAVRAKLVTDGVMG